MYVCRHCGRVFKSPQALGGHQGAHRFNMINPANKNRFTVGSPSWVNLQPPAAVAASGVSGISHGPAYGVQSRLAGHGGQGSTTSTKDQHQTEILTMDFLKNFESNSAHGVEDGVEVGSEEKVDLELKLGI